MPIFLALFFFLLVPFPSYATSPSSEDAPPNACTRSDKRGFSCYFNIGSSPPQTDAEIEDVARQCFEALQRSCNDQQGGTTCRWTARFTCKKIIGRARQRNNSTP
ncbi:MAG: hypothetical protein GDA50_04635 [Alphaproteobacteria bacterium GM202ARS2]|nr:hypothetical protein [Alphaproteobacteria bacterium GM202ARS2]